MSTERPPYRLIKFDVIHPREWLRAKQAAHPNLAALDIFAYRDWLNGLASNYSDFYTHYLNQLDEWEAEEYYLLDPVFVDKMADYLYGPVRRALLRLRAGLKQALGHGTRNWADQVLRDYVRRRDPDVLFVRSQPRPSRFWRQFSPRSLLVARLSARLPDQWHPNDFDLIYTDQLDFKTFFELHGTPTILNKQGFDPRVAGRLVMDRPKRGVVFVGGVGTQNFSQRTEFLEALAAALGSEFRWWGYFWEYGGDGRTLADFPALAATFQGPTSGLEMYQLYHDALVVVNDYVDTANGIGFNQRMFEVMGAGGFLLTRAAPNFAKDFEAGLFATYTDLESCLTQIAYYRTHPEKRQLTADRGQRYVWNHYGYPEISRAFAADLEKQLRSRGTSE